MNIARIRPWLVASAILASLGPVHAESGIASVYTAGEGTGRPACGGSMRDGALTAAHKTLPCGSRVRVTNHRNGKSVIVTITDRGPFVKGRVIDLTTAAASALGFSGITPVTISR